jgi:hypothetical protein
MLDCSEYRAWHDDPDPRSGSTIWLVEAFRPKPVLVVDDNRALSAS